MDRYAYLLLCLFALLPVAVVYAKRQDLRPLLIRAGLAGGVAGWVSELFYFRDYWQPLGILGINRTLPEDFLFGFALFALSATAFAFLTNKRFEPAGRPRRKELGGLFAACLIALVICNVVLGVNSIIVTSIIFALAGLAMIYIRRDLFKPAVISAGLVTLYFLPVYFAIFYLLVPGWWQEHWLLNGTVYDVKLLGSIPLTEFLWYACWSFMGAVLLPFYKGLEYKL